MSSQQTSQQSTSSCGEGPVGKGNYTVKQGECIESIAYEKGFFWEDIWNHSENNDLKNVRKDPNTLLPGDKVFVPEKVTKEACEATEDTHKFMRKGLPSIFVIVLLDNGEPRANKNYTLNIDGQILTGTTDGNGKLQHKIMPNARQGHLIVGDGEAEYFLNFRHLDPVSEPSGIQARLANLGYYPGPLDGKLGHSTKGALRRFQEDQGLEPTGEPDDTTLDKLEQVYSA